MPWNLKADETNSADLSGYSVMDKKVYLLKTTLVVLENLDLNLVRPVSFQSMVVGCSFWCKVSPNDGNYLERSATLPS